ncbi:uncharacterized protein GIQ15_06650 [Arthroderma uncinatum]|uniref:uncharacterized protein n=1 Tax=Arthroderma uncinatum TaxID=74035 RepID=UPI00144A6786|nr:uncharacterized protein GIQ15_06650 [Arthroderma uncinatum]KAF3479674.1 hypothetical protein GIQ15_06650 [Arthroderma uncinatum]
MAPEFVSLTLILLTLAIFLLAVLIFMLSWFERRFLTNILREINEERSAVTPANAFRSSTLVPECQAYDVHDRYTRGSQRRPRESHNEPREHVAGRNSPFDYPSPILSANNTQAKDVPRSPSPVSSIKMTGGVREGSNIHVADEPCKSFSFRGSGIVTDRASTKMPQT